MGISINSGIGLSPNSSGWGVNTNSKQFKAAWNDIKNDLAKEFAIMTPEERLLQEIFFKNQGIKNRMELYNSDGEYIGPGGIVVPGMSSPDGDSSSYHKIVSVSEEARQKMFDETKRYFIQENGVANGDKTNRPKIFREYQLSVPKNKRRTGTWTLEQYEKQYAKAFFDAAKRADPEWEIGKPIPSGALDGIQREAIDKNLVKGNNQFGETFMRNAINVTV